MTLEMAVAPIALAMANHPDLEAYDLSSLRYIMWGATPITPSVAERVSARTGVRWLPAYGTSEVPVIAANPVGRSGQVAPRFRRAPGRRRLAARRRPRDRGGPRPRVASARSRSQSASAMAGYLPDEATAAAFDDGWYRTGDVGWLEPEGWVHLTDRCKEMIKVSGFQVAPAEIEAVLHGHPAVVDCAVFGVPDERRGEVPVAAVQLEPGSDVTADGPRTARRRHAGHLQAAAPRRPRRRRPADAVGQGAAAHAARRVGADRCGRARPTDGRPPLARAGGAARRRRAGGRPPGRARRGRARRPRARRQARRRGRRLRLARAADGDGRRDARGPRRSRSPSWPRSSAGAWPTPPSSAPTLAAELRRLAGAPAAARARDGRADAPTSGRPPRPRTAGCRRERRRARRPCRRRRRWCSWAAARRLHGRHRRARGRPTTGVDLTRPVAPAGARRGPSPRSTGRPDRSIPTTWRRGAASAWP